MNSRLITEHGRPVIEVRYDERLLNFNEAIAMAYSLHGVRPEQVRVICLPEGLDLSGNPRKAAEMAPSHAQTGLPRPLQGDLFEAGVPLK